ncbi:MAG: hypothetical protein U9N59_12340 [Campylobacterota bacterium]|nr:hypothetical protein [Campylobacterota bacterium]
MYVAKILLPATVKGEGDKTQLTPDRVLIESIFTHLHTEQFKAGKNYKYILDFPRFKDKNIGNQINIFSKTKEGLINHIKSEKLYRLITDNCQLKIEPVETSKDTKYHRLKIAKESSGLGLSKIKRLIKREKGEVYAMYKRGMSLDEIAIKLSKDEKGEKYNQFIRYNSRENAHKAYFYIKPFEVDSNSMEILDFNKINSFGFGDTAIPHIPFF